jgi:hypothetical protein
MDNNDIITTMVGSKVFVVDLAVLKISMRKKLMRNAFMHVL